MALRVTTVFTGLQGAPYYNRLHFTGTTQSQAEDAAEAASGLWADLATAIVNECTIQVQPEVVSINDVTGEPDGVFTVTGLEPLVGGSSGVVLPYICQGLIRLRTGVYDGGREIRGRIFVPGLTEELSVDGNPSSALVSDYNTKMADFITATAGTFAVWSKKAGATAIVTGGTLWNQWAFLRSRRD